MKLLNYKIFVSIIIAITMFFGSTSAMTQGFPAMGLIVKYKAGSPEQEVIERASTEERTSATLALTRSAEMLSKGTGIPLVFGRRTSGNEAVYTFDIAAIIGILNETLSDLDGVDSVRPALPREMGALRLPGPGLVIALKPNWINGFCAQCAKHEAPKHLSTYVADYAGQNTTIPVHGEMLDDRQVLLAIDIPTTASKVLRFLNSQENIEYVQPDRMLTNSRGWR